MSKTQFLLFLTSIIPLANCLLISLFKSSPKSVNIISKFLPILFFMNLIGLLNAYQEGANLMLLAIPQGVSLGFTISKMALIFLFLLNFIWLIFAFYSNRFFDLSGVKNANEFHLFFAAIVALTNLILISKNLLTILLFYQCLIFLCHFFAVKFLYKQDSKLSYSLTFLLYLESVFFFFAAVATYKFTGQIDFNSGLAIAEKLSQSKNVILLVLYLSSLFLPILFPSYLLYRNTNLILPAIYAVFFVGLVFSSIYIFIKLLIFIFGFSAFSIIISKVGFSVFEWIFLFNLGLSAIFLLFSKNLKSVFFYLFFNQFIFALFSVFIFALFDKSRIYLPLLSFSLAITLIFLCLSNFILYLAKGQDKGLKGLFYDLKITSSLLIFAILNLIGIVPALGAFEKFFIAKIIFQKELMLSGIIFITNFITLVAFACKIIYPLLARVENKRSSADIELAKAIDYDSSLMLTALVTAIAAFLLPIIFQLKTNIFNL